LRELVDTTLDYSDNVGGNMLIRLLGGFYPLNGLAQKLGLTDTRLERFFMDLGVRGQGIDNLTSVSDLAKLFEMLSNGTAVSAQASASVLAKLQHRQSVNPSWTGRLLPQGAVLASINGLLPGERIEVSLMQDDQGRKGVLAVVLKDQADEDAAQNLIGTIARSVYDALSTVRAISFTPTPLRDARADVLAAIDTRATANTYFYRTLDITPVLAIATDNLLAVYERELDRMRTAGVYAETRRAQFQVDSVQFSDADHAVVETDEIWDNYDHQSSDGAITGSRRSHVLMVYTLHRLKEGWRISEMEQQNVWYEPVPATGGAP